MSACRLNGRSPSSATSLGASPRECKYSIAVGLRIAQSQYQKWIGNSPQESVFLKKIVFSKLYKSNLQDFLTRKKM
jgi:hypothetical protein